MRYVVTGAGGFIGSHMVERLKAEGHWVRAVDIKPRPDFGLSPADEYVQCDLRHHQAALAALAGNGSGFDRAFLFAANMGGMSWLHDHRADVMADNGRINENCVDAAWQTRIGRVFFSSSACVYREDLQETTELRPLNEGDAFPACPDLAYGWEKLYAELRLRYYREQYGLESRVARFHNIYGVPGLFDGGKEKAPAAACRKVARAKLTKAKRVEVWGDGEQTRSFLYIDDALDGILALMESDHTGPVNIGSDEMVSINQLYRYAILAAGWSVTLEHDLTKPQGVRGRNSDNTLCRNVLGWEPSISLQDGIARTYLWIEQQLRGGA